MGSAEPSPTHVLTKKSVEKGGETMIWLDKIIMLSLALTTLAIALNLLKS